MIERVAGLSLSICVNDIIHEQVDLATVDGIVTASAARTPEELDALLTDYREIYWRDDPDAAEEIVRSMLARNQIFQPRLEGKPAPRPIPRHWFTPDGDWRASYPMDTI